MLVETELFRLQAEPSVSGVNERPCISVIGVTISYCRYFGAAKDLPGVRELFQQTGKFLNKATTVAEPPRNRAFCVDGKFCE